MGPRVKPQTDSEVVEVEEIKKVKTEPEQQMVASYEQEKEFQDYQETEEYCQDQSGEYEGGAHQVVDFEQHGAQGIKTEIALETELVQGIFPVMGKTGPDREMLHDYIVKESSEGKSFCKCTVC